MILKGKNVILTGCAGGIGRATLERLSMNGANVWACVRKPSDEFTEFIKELEERYQVEITPLYFDFQNEIQMKEAIKAIRATKKTVDALVNNAGVTYNALFQMTTVDKLREVFEVNFFSQFIFTQYIVKLMVRQRHGAIVNISSSAALDGNSGRSAYGASKAAVLCMTKAMAEELSEFNIRVNAIAPGITNTNMVGASMTDEVIYETVNQTKLKRIGQPSEIGDAILFLISDMSNYVTGQTLRVDGGLK